MSSAAIDSAAASDTPAASLQAIADLQGQLNASLAKQGGPGGGATFGGFTQTGISFNQIFARPVVVGYEAVSIVGK